MDKEEAAAKLQSAQTNDRRKAARYYLHNSTADDQEFLRSIYHKERDFYVRRRLQVTLATLSEDRLESDEPIQADKVDAVKEEAARARAIEWVASTILHEVEPKIGAIRLAASTEIQHFGESTTKVRIDRLEAVLTALGMLRRAAAVPRYQDVDISQLIRDAVAEEAGDRLGQISFIGPKDLTMKSDPYLLELCIGNGIRNALEATANIEDFSGAPAVVVQWGRTDRDIWISITDHGTGLAGTPEAAFAVGRTNKRGHTGFGLPIVQQAVKTLNGKVTLGPGKAGGAILEFRLGGGI